MITNLKISNIANSVAQISLLVYNGFKSKFTTRLFNDQEVLKIITAFCQYLVAEKPEKLFISKDNETISGCLFLTSSEEEYPGLSSSLKKALSFSQWLKLLLLLGLLSHKPQPNERYIDFLTVAPEFRKQGIGKALITHCKNIFPNEALTLNVAEQNYQARKLYDKLGFKIVKEQNSSLMELIVGLRGWQFMKWQ